MLTPSDHEQRGCQLSLSLVENFKGIDPKALEHALFKEGVVVDFRGQIIRIAPHPLWNSFEDVFLVVESLKEVLKRFK